MSGCASIHVDWRAALHMWTQSCIIQTTHGCKGYRLYTGGRLLQLEMEMAGGAGDAYQCLDSISSVCGLPTCTAAVAVALPLQSRLLSVETSVLSHVSLIIRAMLAWSSGFLDEARRPLPDVHVHIGVRSSSPAMSPD